MPEKLPPLPGGDSLGPDTKDPKQKADFENAELGAWGGRYREYFDLYQRQIAGDFLTPAEEDRFLTLRGEIADHEQTNPDRHKRLMTVIKNSTQARTDVNQDGVINDADLSSLISSTFSQSTKTTSRAAQQTQQTTVEYVDLPTPEEFLDDFNNAFNIHVTGLVQSGAVRPEVAAFARQFQGEIFGEYLRKQTELLLKGEPLWKVVGQDAQNRLVGSRTGDQTDTATAREEQSRSNINRSESSSATTGATTGAGQAVESSSGSTSGTIEETSDLYERSKFDQTEAIVARNQLSYVANLAPLDFFKDAATSQRLNFLYAGQKGTEQRSAQTASGRESASARRI